MSENLKNSFFVDGKTIYAPTFKDNKLHPLSTFSSLEEKNKYFGEVQYIDSELDFDNLFKILKSTQNYVYRGVKEAKFRLYSSSQRVFERIDSSNASQNDYYIFIQSILDKIQKSKNLKGYFSEKQIPLTDFLYLALLQHYGYPSPLLDFSYSLEAGLFFMVDKMEQPHNSTNSIDQYGALYLINRNDSEFCSIQDVNLQGAYAANRSVVDARMNGINIVGLSEQAKHSFKELPYSDYKNINYFKIEGHFLGKTTITIPSLGFLAEYDINNPRLNAQAGLFIFNGNAFKPLEQLVTEQSHNRHITCININKKLKPYIETKYLNGVSYSTIYPNDKDSKCINMWLMKIRKFKPINKKTLKEKVKIIFNYITK